MNIDKLIPCLGNEPPKAGRFLSFRLATHHDELLDQDRHSGWIFPGSARSLAIGVHPLFVGEAFGVGDQAVTCLPDMALILYPRLEMIARPKEVEPRILGGDPQFD